MRSNAVCLFILLLPGCVCADPNTRTLATVCKPVVFFDYGNLTDNTNNNNCKYDCCTVPYIAVESAQSKVHEMNELNKKYKSSEQISQIGQQKCSDAYTKLNSETQNGTTNIAEYYKRKTEIDVASQVISIKQQEDMKSFNDQYLRLDKKIAEAVKAVALQRGACAVVTARYVIDPAYDITDEVIAALNKEYDATQQR